MPHVRGFSGGVKTKAQSWFVVALAAAWSCAPPPPRFPEGDSWTFPLVDPLSGGRLLTEVYIHGTGPYLFVLDPTASESYVDAEIWKRLGIVRCCGWIQAGELRLVNFEASFVPGHSFDADGRRIMGVLRWSPLGTPGVFGFDRERGIAWISRDPAAELPNSHLLDLADVRINNGRKLDMPIAFGRTISTLSPDAWSELKIQGTQRGGALLDPDWRFTPFQLSEVAQVSVTVGPITCGTELAPIAIDEEHDGTLSLDFFEPYSVALDYDEVYVAARRSASDTRAERIARWGARLPTCAGHGCATFDVHAAVLTVQPEPIERNLEVVLRARKSGASLHDIEVNLVAGSPGVSVPLPPAYDDAEIEVIDASPFPRLCRDPNLSCVLVEGYSVE